jgi:hypothetical protein
MCDYSLQYVKSRAADVADKLVVHDFGSGTKGFAAPDELGTAVCVLPGTEIAFAEPIKYVAQNESYGWEPYLSKYATARFRQINLDNERTHHDALELPDGQQILLTHLTPGQEATVLQLPAAPKTEAEAKEQQRLEVVA